RGDRPAPWALPSIRAPWGASASPLAPAGRTGKARPPSHVLERTVDDQAGGSPDVDLSAGGHLGVESQCTAVAAAGAGLRGDLVAQGQGVVAGHVLDGHLLETWLVAQDRLADRPLQRLDRAGERMHEIAEVRDAEVGRGGR